MLFFQLSPHSLPPSTIESLFCRKNRMVAMATHFEAPPPLSFLFFLLFHWEAFCLCSVGRSGKGFRYGCMKLVQLILSCQYIILLIKIHTRRSLLIKYGFEMPSFSLQSSQKHRKMVSIVIWPSKKKEWISGYYLCDGNDVIGFNQLIETLSHVLPHKQEGNSGRWHTQKHN